MKPASENTSKTKELLAAYGKVRSQSKSNWRGSFTLPPALVDFYKNVGPVDLSIRAYGNSYFLPSLAKLWEFQAGYRWNGLTRKPISTWDDNWIVVADQGGDPLIFDRGTSQVLFAHHGGGVWKPQKCFADVPTMAMSLGILGSIILAAGQEFTDEEGFVRPEYRKQAVQKLTGIVRSRADAAAIISVAGWL